MTNVKLKLLVKNYFYIAFFVRRHRKRAVMLQTLTALNVAFLKIKAAGKQICYRAYVNY